MINIKRLSIKNVVHYKSAEVFIQPGLHVIRGLNKSSRNKNQNNGAGKSLLFAPFANMFIGKAPTAKSKRGGKELLNEKSCVEVSFTTHSSKEVDITQFHKGFSILEDGIDLGIAGQTKAEKQIQEYFPLNEHEFFSTCFVTARPLLFQIQSPTERLKFISDLFRLHEYDDLKKYFSVRLRGIKDSETEYKTLQSRLQHSLKMQKEIGWNKSLKRELEELEYDIEQMQASAAALQEELLTFTKLNVVHSQYTKLSEAIGKRSLASVKERYAECKNLVEQCYAYDEYQRDYAQYLNNTKSLQEKINKLQVEGDHDYKSVQADLEVLEKRIAEYDTELRKHVNAQEAFEQHIKAIAKLTKKVEAYTGKKFKSKDTIEEGLAQCKTTLKLEKLLQHAHDDTVQCPTCNTALKSKELEQLVADAHQDYAMYELALEWFVAKTELIDYEDTLPDYDEDAHAALYKKRKSAQSTYDDLEHIAETLRVRKTYEQTLKTMQKPEPVTEPEYETEVVEKELEKCKSVIALFDQRSTLCSEHDDYDPASYVDAKPEKQESYTKLVSKLNAMVARERELTNKRTEHKLTYQTILDIESELAKLQEAVEEKEIVEALVNAYGSKGLKIKAINNITRTLEQNFNTIAPFIFNENFEFELATDSSGIHAIVHRPKGFHSDVSTLSGAESNCFKMLFLTSLLPMMPQDRRTNLVILDEPSANMDSVSKDKFIHDFLPQLLQVVPSLYILSTDDEDYPNATNMVVVKEKGVSKLVMA